MKFRIFRCDPRVRGPGFWQADSLSWDERRRITTMLSRDGVRTPLHPSVIDQRFAQDPRFYWVPRKVNQNHE